MEGTEQEGGRWQEAAWVCSGKCGAVPAGSGGDWRGGGEAGNKHRAIEMPPPPPCTLRFSFFYRHNLADTGMGLEASPS